MDEEPLCASGTPLGRFLDFCGALPSRKGELFVSFPEIGTEDTDPTALESKSVDRVSKLLRHPQEDLEATQSHIANTPHAVFSAVKVLANSRAREYLAHRPQAKMTSGVIGEEQENEHEEFLQSPAVFRLLILDEFFVFSSALLPLLRGSSGVVGCPSWFCSLR